MKKEFKNIGLKKEKAVPNERQMEWYQRQGCIFFHFGMNTFTGKEWGDGYESPADFNPTELDVEQWISTIKEAGFTCAILTAKHHDGFCLWQTEYTSHSIKNSPYKNGKGDIVREFTSACQKYGIKAGIYLSPWDRHEKTWGKDEYNDFYVGQLTELLTNYGEIYEVWWDGAGSTEAVYDWERWAKTVRALQPNAVIFGSLGATPWVDVRWVGNEKGIAGKPCYATIDEHSLVVENTSELNRGKLDGERFIPAEVDVSIRPGWFYHSEQDADVRDCENLMQLWFNSIGSNAGFLLNLPPDKRGLIHENDVKSLLEFKSSLDSLLSNNLAQNCKFSGQSVDNYPLDNLIKKDKFFVPREKSFEFEVALPKKEKINTLMISEAIELGHKVTKIKASAFVNNTWQELFVNDIIGYKLAQRFDTVMADRIKVEITSVDIPALSCFGLYYYEKSSEKSKTKSEKNILSSSLAQVSACKNEIDVNLGGIVPFNVIKVKNVGDVSFKLQIFNGTSLETVNTGNSVDGKIEIFLDTVIDYAYRFKIVLDKDICKDIEIQAYNT